CKPYGKQGSCRLGTRASIPALCQQPDQGQLPPANVAPTGISCPSSSPLPLPDAAVYDGSFQTVAITRSDRLIARSSAKHRTAIIRTPLRSFAGCSHARYASAAETRIANHVQALNTLRSVVNICVTSG